MKTVSTVFEKFEVFMKSSGEKNIGTTACRASARAKRSMVQWSEEGAIISLFSRSYKLVILSSLRSGNFDERTKT